MGQGLPAMRVIPAGKPIRTMPRRPAARILAGERNGTRYLAVIGNPPRLDLAEGFDAADWSGGRRGLTR